MAFRTWILQFALVAPARKDEAGGTVNVSEVSELIVKVEIVRSWLNIVGKSFSLPPKTREDAELKPVPVTVRLWPVNMVVAFSMGTVIGVAVTEVEATLERSEATSAVTMARFLKRKRSIALIVITLQVSG